MRIRKTEVENSIEKLIIAGMITSSKFMREFQHLYKPKYLEIPYARTVGNWCLEYFKKYGKAPRRHIQDIYNANVRKGLNETEADLIGRFLGDISEEFANGSRVNKDYLLDQAAKRFEHRDLAVLSEDVQNLLSRGKTMEAKGLLANHRNVGLPKTQGVNPFTDVDLIRDAFEEDTKPLFSYTGAMGKLMNDQLTRDSFVAEMAGEKRGKTWRLIDLAIRAFKFRNNVAFFEVGDMSLKQISRRLHVRISGKNYNRRYCQEQLVPTLDCKRNQADTCKKRYRSCRCGLPFDMTDFEINYRSKFEEAPEEYLPCAQCARTHPERYQPAIWWRKSPAYDPLRWREGLRYGRQFVRSVSGKEFKLVAYPAKTVNVQMIRQQLDIWEQHDGFVADVIVVDYADILAPEDARQEFRHQQNDSWAALRSLSLDKHALVATATQADAGSYTQRSLKQTNFSEDKRKYAHVTLMTAFNQTEIEKKMGICRIATMVQREGEFSTLDEITVLQHLASGKPILASF